MLSVINDCADQPDSSLFVRLQASHRCVAYLDRYCGAVDHNILMGDLQKFGGACVVLALQLKTPELIELSLYEWICLYTDGAVAVDQMVQATKSIYSTLSVGTGRYPDLEGNAGEFMYADLMLGNSAELQNEPSLVSGCNLDNKNRLWPTCLNMKISRDDDDLCLMVCISMLKKIKKANETSSTFFLSQYVLELTMQVGMDTCIILFIRLLCLHSLIFI